MTARRFRAGRDGVAVRLSRQEREAFAAVLSQFRALLLNEAHPSLMRFQPPVHIHDSEAEKEFWDMVGGQLLRHRLKAIETVEAGLEDSTIDHGAVEAWLQTINGLRLYLGDAIGVAQAMFEPPGPDSEPDQFGRFALYEWLGGLLDQLVSVAGQDLAADSGE